MYLLHPLLILFTVVFHNGSKVELSGQEEGLDPRKPIILVIPCTATGQNKFDEVLITDLRNLGLELESVWCLNKNPDIERDDMRKINDHALDVDVSQILRIQYLDRRIASSDPVFDSPDFKGQLTVSLHRPKAGSLFVTGEPVFMFSVFNWRSLLQKVEKRLI